MRNPQSSLLSKDKNIDTIFNKIRVDLRFDRFVLSKTIRKIITDNLDFDWVFFFF